MFSVKYFNCMTLSKYVLYVFFHVLLLDINKSNLILSNVKFEFSSGVYI